MSFGLLVPKLTIGRVGDRVSVSFGIRHTSVRKSSMIVERVVRLFASAIREKASIRTLLSGFRSGGSGSQSANE
jgi:hypothetical protein